VAVSSIFMDGHRSLSPGSRRNCWLLLGILALVLESQSVFAIEVRTVALTGQQAPGTDPGAVFNGFSAPRLNDSGDIAFTATLQTGAAGVTASNAFGLWKQTNGPLGLVARTGSQAPGAPAGVNFSTVANRRLAMNGSGQVVFDAQLQTGVAGVTGGNQDGIWADSGSQLAMVARTGSQPPGVPAGAMYTTLSVPEIDATGDVSFVGGMVTDAGGVSGIWKTASGSLGLAYLQGDQVPGEIDGVSYGTIQSASMNSTGKLTFYAPPQHVGKVGGVWSEGTSPAAFMAYIGAAAPGAGIGVRFDGMGPPSINDAGQVAFWGVLTGGPVPSKFAGVDNGLWVQRSGALELIGRQGNAAVGEPAGSVFDSFFDRGVLNGAGNVAFRGSVSRLNGGFYTFSNYGIWAERGGAVSLVDYEGAQAMGLASGTTYARLGDYSFNDRGQVAFDGTLSTFGSTGIWAQDANGLLHLIAATGQQLDVDDGPGVNLKTISGVTFAGASSGTGNAGGGLNNRGQIAFAASFTDGTWGAFISDAVAVPEPSAVKLSIVALAMVAAMRARKAMLQ
jgi:hypothetical protein